MKTNHLYTKILLFFSILNSGLITIHAQTYNFTTTRKNWHLSVDSLSYISPDSLIRNEHLIQIPSNGAVRDTPSNIINNSEAHSHIPTSATIDTNKDVGEIPFSSNVSPSSAVIYNIPINISTGRNGFQPNISITYNSQGDNDILGYGWSISGLSTITRMHKNIYYDGKAAPMLLNVNDAFMLDGVRLLPVNNQINTYEPERGNMRIKANVSENIINSFIVEYPNGNRGIYSRTNNISFPITHLEDTISNYITFTYESSNNHDYIKKIKYGEVKRYDSG